MILAFRIGGKRVTLTFDLGEEIEAKLLKAAVSKKTSPSLFVRDLIEEKYKDWDGFSKQAKFNCRSMNLESKKMIYDYFSS